MSHTKRALENLSMEMGFRGEVNAAVVAEAKRREAPDTTAIEAKLKELKAKIDADKRKEIEAEVIGRLERGVRGEAGLWPDWVYEARDAIRHQNEKIPWLPDLLKILGWQGGTVHQALNAVARLVEADKEKNKPRCDACGWPNKADGSCSRMQCCNAQ